ncbi:hypothetical protein KFE25_000574 [Diacronema lutheri]|uniref:Uncharacterized protein n=1 Tax=Diacronema lutheri TaxID=2081491 RepID=A0A8J6CH11_DIALT|nr:hypothetical protein KFE25_000574 [Diacronema lutheri]
MHWNSAVEPVLTAAFGIQEHGSLRCDGASNGSEVDELPSCEELRNGQNAAWAEESVRYGIARAKEGRYTEALEAYGKALDLCPRHVDALVGRGAALANLNRLKEAVAEFESAVQLDPEHPNARAYRDTTLHKLRGSAPAAGAHAGGAARFELPCVRAPGAGASVGAALTASSREGRCAAPTAAAGALPMRTPLPSAALDTHGPDGSVEKVSAVHGGDGEAETDRQRRKAERREARKEAKRDKQRSREQHGRGRSKSEKKSKKRRRRSDDCTSTSDSSGSRHGGRQPDVRARLVGPSSAGAPAAPSVTGVAEDCVESVSGTERPALFKRNLLRLAAGVDTAGYSFV